MLFNNYRESVIIKDNLKSKHIIVGEYSYYAGYYDGKPFEECVMYLDEIDNNTDAGKIDRLIIGKFCSIASGARFMMGGNQGHDHQWIATYPFDLLDDNFDNHQSTPKGYKLKGDTQVGNDVWIGAQAMIMPGIQIADGAVIGALSLVTKNVGPYEIWGGNPASLIKRRFDLQKIEKLLEIKWWNWDIKDIKMNLDLLRSNNIDSLWKEFHKK